MKTSDSDATSGWQIACAIECKCIIVQQYLSTARLTQLAPASIWVSRASTRSACSLRHIPVRAVAKRPDKRQKKYGKSLRLSSGGFFFYVLSHYYVAGRLHKYLYYEEKDVEEVRSPQRGLCKGFEEGSENH